MCDTIAAAGAATAEHTVLFGKNSDRPYDEAQYLQLIPEKRHAVDSRVRLTHKEIAQVPTTYAVLISKPHWIWGAEIGANEHGLAIGNEAVFSMIEASSEPGIIGMDYLRLALERAKDVDEGIQVITTLLREHGQSGNCRFRGDPLAYHNSFILADPKGVKVLETVEREWVVMEVKDYYAISNTISIEDRFESASPTLKGRAAEAGLYEGGESFGFKKVYEDTAKVASGHHRRARAMELLAHDKGSLRQTDFFRILRDHHEGVPAPGRSSGPRICGHTRANPLGQTTASWVAELARGKTVHWVTGVSAPCTGLFKPVLFEGGLPDHGPPPGAEEDNASLWWRHEQLRRSLDDARPEVRLEFITERDALEARFLEAVAEFPAPIDEKTRDEAHRTIRSCWQEAQALESRWYQRIVT